MNDLCLTHFGSHSLDVEFRLTGVDSELTLVVSSWIKSVDDVARIGRIRTLLSYKAPGIFIVKRMIGLQVLIKKIHTCVVKGSSWNDFGSWHWPSRKLIYLEVTTFSCPFGKLSMVLVGSQPPRKSSLCATTAKELNFPYLLSLTDIASWFVAKDLYLAV